MIRLLREAQLDRSYTGEMAMDGTAPRPRSLLNPSVMAAAAFRGATRGSKIKRRFFRYFCIVVFSSDISPDCSLSAPLNLPHPTGIVIGNGVKTCGRATIYQNVTLGTGRRGGYPEVHAGVTIFAGAVVSGKLMLGECSVIGANAVVTRSVAPSDTVRAPR